jgi:hypothetical protein
MYSKEKYNASFVGFFPADDPQIVLLVLLDSPTNGYYGGQVAAPIFREIALRITGTAVRQSEPVLVASADTSVVRFAAATQTRIPDLRGLGTDAAARVCEKFGLRVLVQGEGRVVLTQEPAVGSTVDPHSVVTLETTTGASGERMPDLRGLSLRRALNVLGLYRLKPHVSGDGTVRSQSPAPTAPLPSGGVATLVCDR